MVTNCKHEYGLCGIDKDEVNDEVYHFYCHKCLRFESFEKANSPIPTKNCDHFFRYLTKGSLDEGSRIYAFFCVKCLCIKRERK